MNNKGFTLIELLAVIVILAIIALIATPIILNIINDARDSAKERTAELVVSQLETAYSTAYMTNGGNYPTLAQVAAKFSMDGASASVNGSTGALEITVDMDGVTCVVTDDTSAKTISVECDPGDKVSPTLTYGTAAASSNEEPQNGD